MPPEPSNQPDPIVPSDNNVPIPGSSITPSSGDSNNSDGLLSIEHSDLEHSDDTNIAISEPVVSSGLETPSSTPEPVAPVSPILTSEPVSPFEPATTSTPVTPPVSSTPISPLTPPVTTAPQMPATSVPPAEPIPTGTPITPQAAPINPIEASQPVANAYVSSDLFTPSTGALGASAVTSSVSSAQPSSSATKTSLFGKFKSSKKMMFIFGGLALLIIGSLGFYFGYYTNSSVIWTQSLADTGKAYSILLSSAQKQNLTAYKGSTTTGSFTLKGTGFSADGTLSAKTNQKNTDSTANIDVLGNKINLELITANTSGSNPDVYIKASGLKTITELAAIPGASDIVSQVDGKWIAIDHTILDSYESAVSSAGGGLKGPTSVQVLDELKAFGNVNQKYLFTANKSRNVLVVQKKYGIEAIDGHKVYHYKVGFNDAHLKTYINAQKTALNSSKLGAWIKQNNYTDEVNSSFDSMSKSASNVKSSDYFDLWSDINTRVIYKIRIHDTPPANPALNYLDIGSGYKGGSTIPLFMNLKLDDGTGKTNGAVNIGYNTKTNNIAFHLTITGGSGSSIDNADVKLNYSPTITQPTINVPSNAISINQLITSLGGDPSTLLSNLILGGGGSTYPDSTAPVTAANSKRQADMQSIQTQLEGFFSQYGYYPNLTDMNNASWVSKNMPTLDVKGIKDPSTNGSFKLVAKPAAKAYSYEVFQSDGTTPCETDDTTCAVYTLTATLSDGSTYVKNNLD